MMSMIMFTTMLARIGAEVSPGFSDQALQVWDFGIKFRRSLISRKPAVCDLSLDNDLMKLGLTLEDHS